MAEVANELIYEVLKSLQERMSNLDSRVVGNVEQRLSRIERRLDLTETSVK